MVVIHRTNLAHQYSALSFLPIEGMVKSRIEAYAFLVNLGSSHSSDHSLLLLTIQDLTVFEEFCFKRFIFYIM